MLQPFSPIVNICNGSADKEVITHPTDNIISAFYEIKRHKL